SARGGRRRRSERRRQLHRASAARAGERRIADAITKQRRLCPCEWIATGEDPDAAAQTLVAVARRLQYEAQSRRHLDTPSRHVVGAPPEDRLDERVVRRM